MMASQLDKMVAKIPKTINKPSIEIMDDTPQYIFAIYTEIQNIISFKRSCYIKNINSLKIKY